MRTRPLSWVVWGLICAMALAGCSGSGERQFAPPETTARRALETALNAWKDGRGKPGKLSPGDVAIEVADALWFSGQKLKAYEIVSEHWDGGPRWFAVKLTLATGEQTVKYAVMGKDPIWVFTEGEYKKLSAMGQ